MGCILRISGDKFDVDKFVDSTILKPYWVFQIGQPMNILKPKGKKYNSSGLNILTSDADFDNFDKQLKDSIKYLKKHYKELTAITKDKTITEFVLDFGITSRISTGKVFTQSDTFPSELLKLAGDLNMDICLSQHSESSEFKKLFSDFFKDKKINNA